MSSTSVFPVRLATVRDSKAIAALHNATVKEAFRGMLGDVDVPIMALDKRQAYWREAIEYAEPQVQVALHGERIVGFIGYDRSRDDGSKQTMGEIWAVYVDADFLGLGVGLSLWDSAREGLIEEGLITAQNYQNEDKFNTTALNLFNEYVDARIESLEQQLNKLKPVEVE